MAFKEILNIIKERILAPFQNLTAAQKVTIIFILVLTFAGVIATLKWATKPEMGVLVADLDPADLQKVVEQLKEKDVPYELIQNGRGVKIPREKIYEWRLNLASEDLMTGGSIGYELFDQKDIGISEFVQQVNYRRALEGELARTIQSIQNVERARVHIVFPKDRLFKRDQKEPTASIVLSMRGKGSLSAGQVKGIAMLVAGSVEGLEVDNVTILDDRGNILSVPNGQSSLEGLTDMQLGLQARVESYLEQKAQSMLARVLGLDNVIVRVSAELDFRRIERTSENYDPDNAAVLSEEIQNQTMQDTSASNQSVTEHSIVNYQLTKSVEHIVEDVGSIKRLSVAVLVNHKKVQGQGEKGDTFESVPRTQEELNQIAGLVQSAIGLDPARGDRIDIQNINFETAPLGTDGGSVPAYRWFPIVKRVIYVILLIIGFLVVRAKLKKASEKFIQVVEPEKQPQLAKEEEAQLEAAAVEESPLEEQISPVEREKERIKQGIMKFVDENPASAAKLIQSWMMED